MTSRFIQRADHHGKRFGRPVLAPAQPLDRFFGGGVDQKLKPTEPLHRNNLPVGNRFDRRAECVAAPAEHVAAGVEQAQLGPAVGAGDRLGMEPPVGRRVVFGAARLAHRKTAHRRSRPIVGQPFDDRPPRPAVGAIGKWVAESPLEWIANLDQARLAGGQVGRSGGPARGKLAARADLKRRLACGTLDRVDALHVDRVDPGLRRRFVLKSMQEGVQCGRVALDLDPHPFGLVADPTGQPTGPGRVVDKRPKPHALDHAANRQPKPPEGRRLRGWVCHHTWLLGGVITGPLGKRSNRCFLLLV